MPAIKATWGPNGYTDVEYMRLVAKFINAQSVIRGGSCL